MANCEASQSAVSVEMSQTESRLRFIVGVGAHLLQSINFHFDSSTFRLFISVFLNKGNIFHQIRDMFLVKIISSL